MSLRNKFRRLRNSLPNRQIEQEHYEEIHKFIGIVRDEILSELQDISANTKQVSNQLETIGNQTKANFDHVFDLRRDLVKARASKEYDELYSNLNPLVSVRIPTWNNPELLVERAIKSVQNQTYDNWEIVVVGDGSEDDTEDVIKSLNDDRISFYNFPYRNIYPEDPVKRWQVAGSPGMNKAAELAKGLWIAPLDDDDEFAPNHIELLLKTALEGRYEVVYGNFCRVNLSTGEEQILGSYPPVAGQISTQVFIYPKLLSFFEWEPKSWMVDEPGDWNFIRRMMESGVCIGKVEEVVSTLYSLDPSSK